MILGACLSHESFAQVALQVSPTQFLLPDTAKDQIHVPKAHVKNASSGFQRWNDWRIKVRFLRNLGIFSVLAISTPTIHLVCANQSSL